MPRKRCPHCQAPVSSRAVWCSNCGRKAHSFVTWPVLIGCALLTGVVAWIIWALAT